MSLDGPLLPADWTAELNYLANTDGSLGLSLSGPEARVTVKAGPQSRLCSTLRRRGYGHGPRASTTALTVCLASRPEWAFWRQVDGGALLRVGLDQPHLGDDRHHLDMHLTASHCGGDMRHLDRRVTVMAEQITGRRCLPTMLAKCARSLASTRQHEVGVGQGTTPTQWLNNLGIHAAVKALREDPLDESIPPAWRSRVSGPQGR